MSRVPISTINIYGYWMENGKNQQPSLNFESNFFCFGIFITISRRKEHIDWLQILANKYNFPPKLVCLFCFSCVQFIGNSHHSSIFFLLSFFRSISKSNALVKCEEFCSGLQFIFLLHPRLHLVNVVVGPLLFTKSSLDKK